jgi:dienelactone hydrolase
MVPSFDATVATGTVGVAFLASLLIFAAMSPSPCCPPGSIDAALSFGIAAGGRVVKLRNGRESGRPLPCYVAGPLSGAHRAILVGHDIFGPLSGRTKLICDALAAKLPGTLVLMPYFFDDRPIAGFFSRMRHLFVRLLFTRWHHVRPGVEAALRYAMAAMEQDATRSAPLAGDGGDSPAPRRIGLVGFCWGGWFVLKTLAAFPHLVACSVAFHGSPQLCWLHCERINPMARAVRCPTMWLAGWNDPGLTKKGGALESVLLEHSGTDHSFVSFSMRHGWVNRGNMSDEKVAQEVRRALYGLAMPFLSKHLR